MSGLRGRNSSDFLQDFFARRGGSNSEGEGLSFLFRGRNSESTASQSLSDLIANRRSGDSNGTSATGTEDHHLNGSARGELLRGSQAAEDLSGLAGNDRLVGNGGADKIWGGSGNDTISGGSGADILVGGMGADRVTGGSGNDVLLSRSDEGEQNPAQGGSRVYGAQSDALGASNDTLTGGTGGDTFRFEGLLNAKPEIIAKHTGADGTIDWAGVTGENGAVHDHWVDQFGNDVITDFNRAQGDKIEIAAHTAEVKSIEQRDVNGDGRLDSVITVISQQGAAGAHDEDLLGTITVYGDLVQASDITTDAGVTYGAYDKAGQGPYVLEDDGILPGGQSDGGHHEA